MFLHRFGGELIIIGVFTLVIFGIFYRTCVHDEFVKNKKNAYKIPKVKKTKHYLLMGIMKKAKKGSNLKYFECIG